MTFGIIIRGPGGRSQFKPPVSKEHLVSPLDTRDHTLTTMLRDRTMVSMIKNGKGSDVGLKREAEAISRERSKNQKQKWTEGKLKERSEIIRNLGK